MSHHPMHLHEREITDPAILEEILRHGRWTTLALCLPQAPGSEAAGTDGPWPYVLTLSYGYAPEERALYFHTARQGLKLDILRQNPQVCGTVVEERGYLQGRCAQPYRSVVYRGRMEILESLEEKRHGIEVLLQHLEEDPEIMRDRLRRRGETYERVCVLRLRIQEISGKAGQ
ncbi:MAG: pyridoxamine 5'-phosphate oxidase family protein [Chloroflexi bacterium]|nr:pyridoxamine 5'-phosphate oxidase family protein [Chloroflexota bacterium]